MSTSQIFALSEPIYTSFFFGIILATAFYGVACIQTFFYFVHYERDPLRTKMFVAIMWTINSIHEGLGVSAVYKYIMAGLVNPLSSQYGNLELFLLYVATALSAAPTQCFFIYRLYVFSGKKTFVPLVLLVLVLTACVTLIVYVGKAMYISSGTQGVEFRDLNSGIFAFLGTMCLSVAAGIDILIAIFMTFSLIRERIITGFGRTAHLLQLLAVFSVNTGAWTATFALLIVILLNLFPNQVYYAAFVIPLGSVYCNTLLANLNARTYLKGAGQSHDDDANVRSTLWASDSTEGDRRCDQGQYLFSSTRQVIEKTTKMVTFSDRNQSTTAANSM